MANLTNTNHWRVQLLGNLQVSSGEQTISRFRTQVTGALLSYLAYYNGRPQPREVLIEHFWPNVDSKRGRNSLSVALHALRSQLETPGSGSSILIVDNFNVTLNSALFVTDVANFQNALKRARRATDTMERYDLLEEALGHYQGDLLLGRYEPWILPEQIRLQQQMEEAKAELSLLKGGNVFVAAASNIDQYSVTFATSSVDPSTPNWVDPSLPLSFTRFFGRKEELTQLTRLLAPSSAPVLVTLTGIGGIGKTRLAQEAARRLQDSFHGRVWFVALAELQDAERLLDAIREALRLPSEPTTEPLNQICALLNAAPSLLVLDNMEQFVAEGRAALILQTLRERVSCLTCLVTSRQVLGIAGEYTFPVGPLAGSRADEETCIQLFEDRARSVLPSFRVTDASYPIIRQLCAVLDGIPLAIELAAARIGVLPPTQMLAQMEARFALLRSRKRDVPERHQSLWAAIDSSYQLLPQYLKRFFARLSIFRGGWTLDSAQAICLDEDIDSNEALPLVVEFINELQESSLISVPNSDGHTKFQMLDTLRAYAAEQLIKQKHLVETRQRHVDYFASLAFEVKPHLAAGTIGNEPWLDKLEYEHDNLRLAISNAGPGLSLRMANALHRFWFIRGHAAEGRKHLQYALAESASVNNISDSELATAQNALGVLAFTAMSLIEAREHFDKALKYYEMTGNKQDIAKALNNIANVTTRIGDFVGARASYEQSLSLYRTIGDSLRESMVLTNLGGVLFYLKDYVTARQVLEECIVIQRAAQDDFSLIHSLQNLAEVALREGDISAASSAIQESLTFRRILGDQSAFDDVIITASMILGKSNRMKEACMIWAAAQSLRSLAGTAPSPVNASDEESWFRHIIQSLPEKDTEIMLQKGSQMNFDQAISCINELLSSTTL